MKTEFVFATVILPDQIVNIASETIMVLHVPNIAILLLLVMIVERAMKMETAKIALPIGMAAHAQTIANQY